MIERIYMVSAQYNITMERFVNGALCLLIRLSVVAQNLPAQ